ncbi:MAG: hypothetical protein QM737_18500 [Ferruginibacter sp.]
MDIEAYKKVAIENNYDEEEIFHGHPTNYLKDFINYEEADISLKIYLCELIIYRHFMAMGATILPDDIKWFIESYFSTYNADLIDLVRTRPIQEAKSMIMSEDMFGKATVGTVFMFGIIEFYAKYKLGYRPNKYDFFDKDKISYSQKVLNISKSKHIYIKEAFDLLEEGNLPISKSLKLINTKTISKMEELYIDEKRFTKFKISDRIKIARNAMLHGDLLTFFDKGRYMLMIYILFQLNETYEKTLLAKPV